LGVLQEGQEVEERAMLSTPLTAKLAAA